MKIFLDTSVLLAAMLSSSGASAQILKMCEGELIEGYISTELFNEALKVIARKFPQQKQKFEKIISASIRVEKIPAKSPLWKTASTWIKDPDDVMVLVGAKHLEVDWLITLDLRDFIKDTQVAKKSGLKITTPGDFLDEFLKKN